MDSKKGIELPPSSDSDEEDELTFYRRKNRNPDRDPKPSGGTNSSVTPGYGTGIRNYKSSSRPLVQMTAADDFDSDSDSEESQAPLPTGGGASNGKNGACEIPVVTLDDDEDDEDSDNAARKSPRSIKVEAVESGNEEPQTQLTIGGASTSTSTNGATNSTSETIFAVDVEDKDNEEEDQPRNVTRSEDVDCEMESDSESRPLVIIGGTSTPTNGAISISTSSEDAFVVDVEDEDDDNAMNGATRISNEDQDILMVDDEEDDNGGIRISNVQTLIVDANISDGQGKNGARKIPVVTVGDDEDDEDTDNEPRNVNATGESSTDCLNGAEDDNGSGSRRKRKINYAEIENGLDLGDDEPGKQNSKKAFDIFRLSDQKIDKLTQKPGEIDEETSCKIHFRERTDIEKINAATRFFKKCGSQFETMSIHTNSNKENFSFLQNAFKSTTSLEIINCQYLDRGDAFDFLKVLKKSREEDHLPRLHSLQLVSSSGDKSLTEKHLMLLSEINTNFQSLELGDALWEDVKCGTLEKILQQQKTSLERLVIHGGFRGKEKPGKAVNFPRMEKLKTLYICPQNYPYVSEIQNPRAKKARVTKGAVENKEEPYKISIKFPTEIPTLEKIALGNLIQIDYLLISSLRTLKEFRCGSDWNLAIQFPTRMPRLMESTLTEFQFPDLLKDPSLTVIVAKNFPHLKKIKMFLPSVPVVRAFFKAFEDSNVEKLYIKTQFDFESTMETCLLPEMDDVLRKDQKTEAFLQKLKQYKHFHEFVNHYNIELPVQAEDLRVNPSAGIRSLRRLQYLNLEHIPRKLKIPIDKERKWNDPDCKFMNDTFGYEEYPLNSRCCKEILELKHHLEGFEWTKLQIDQGCIDDFKKAGFIKIRDEHNHYDDDDEDLVPSSRRPKPKITSAMLWALAKPKPEVP